MKELSNYDIVSTAIVMEKNKTDSLSSKEIHDPLLGAYP